MTATLAPASAAAVFAFGAAVFYVLSCIERPVMGVLRPRSALAPLEEDVRHVYRSLQRLAPLLPPSNGVVLLAGTTLLIVTGLSAGWSRPVLSALAVYWLTNLYIIAVRRIATDVRDLRRTRGDADLPTVSDILRRLIIQHHINLAASLTAAALCLTATTATT